MNDEHPQRPLFHFTAEAGWLNDPNGLVYYAGEYHLFFQHNPFGTQHANISWGHAVSTDLLHWRQLETALAPDEHGGIFSGSAAIDWANTSGFQTGSEPPMVAAYTAAKKPFSQRIAYSNDRGRTMTKLSGPPVIENMTGFADRDPRIFWHDRTKQWVLVLYLDNKEDHSKRCFGIFNSPDLQDWTLVSRTKDLPFFECPDLFELPIDGDRSRTKWVIHGAEGVYQVGDFDGRTFTPTEGPYELDVLGTINGRVPDDRNFYAAQTFNDIPAEDGRRIQIAWLRGSNFPDSVPFNQHMTFPNELSLRETPDGLRVFRMPVREIETLRQQAVTDPAARTAGRAFDLDLELELTGRTEFRIAPPWDLHYCEASKQLRLADRTIPLDAHGTLRLRILLDVTSIEVFAEEGRSCAVRFISPVEDVAALRCELTRGDYRRFRVHPVNSIWG